MGKDLTKVSTTFQFCDGGSCQKAHSELAVREARAYLRNEELWNDTHTIKTRCNGRCENAPTWIVQPGNFWYKNVTPEKAVHIVKSHCHMDKPINDYLLFKTGWEKLNTTKESVLEAPVFKPKTLPDYGDVLVARGSASDQYLYPLFKKLFQVASQLSLELPYGDVHHITEAYSIDYSEAFNMHILGKAFTYTIAIGPITKAMEKNISPDIMNKKVGVSEVIWQEKNSNFVGAIRLRNRQGKHVLTLHIPVEDKVSWDYIFNVYLNMNPQELRID